MTAKTKLYMNTSHRGPAGDGGIWLAQAWLRAQTVSNVWKQEGFDVLKVLECWLGSNLPKQNQCVPLSEKQIQLLDSMAKTLHSQGREPEFNPGSGN